MDFLEAPCMPHLGKSGEGHSSPVRSGREQLKPDVVGSNATAARVLQRFCGRGSRLVPATIPDSGSALRRNGRPGIDVHAVRYYGQSRCHNDYSAYNGTQSRVQVKLS
jgi:hypothetical protein